VQNFATLVAVTEFSWLRKQELAIDGRHRNLLRSNARVAARLRFERR